LSLEWVCPVRGPPCFHPLRPCPLRPVTYRLDQAQKPCFQNTGSPRAISGCPRNQPSHISMTDLCLNHLCLCQISSHNKLHLHLSFKLNNRLKPNPSFDSLREILNPPIPHPLLGLDETLRFPFWGELGTSGGRTRPGCSPFPFQSPHTALIDNAKKMLL